jgi:hypothetical protein
MNQESVPASITEKNDFWDFRSVNIYRNSFEKVRDLLFGFFAAYVLDYAIKILISLVRFYLFPDSVYASEIIVNILVLVTLISSSIYLFKRRKFISYGLMIKACFIIFEYLSLGVYFLSIYM